jgi:glycosyltransferase involved in cell wall biosynthesis
MSSSSSSSLYPFVSICTPTFNRRPFYEMIIRCFKNQTYPAKRMEWIIIDDGTDKIEDLVRDIPQVKYFKYDTRMNLGKKRNLMHEKARGDILVYMDDDDYYPPDRVSHAVSVLQKNPGALIVGSSEMYIYFKHIEKMYKFGPYGPNHATAATFAFRRDLLKITKYDDHAALAEEKLFLKNYQVPMIQLESMKSILVFSHIHNTFDKKELLNGPASPYITLSDKRIADFIKEPEIADFFIHKIDDLLAQYEPGRPQNKPEVFKQIAEIKEQRTQQQLMQMNQQMNQMKLQIDNMTKENIELKEKNEYLNKKIKELIAAAIKNKTAEERDLKTITHVVL